MALFMGPDAYVSPSWYPSKQEHGKVVPTWNYVAVHAYGLVEFFDDADRLLDVVTVLSGLAGRELVCRRAGQGVNRVLPISYKRHRFPPEVIRYAVWLYFRFALSLRDVEDLLAERGIANSYETVRCWTRKFGRAFARNLRRSRPRPTGTWHLDEMVVKVGGRRIVAATAGVSVGGNRDRSARLICFRSERDRAGTSSPT